MKNKVSEPVQKAYNEEDLRSMVGNMMGIKEAEWIAESAVENREILKKLLEYSFSDDAGFPPLDVVAFLGDNIQDFPGMKQAVRQRGPEAFGTSGSGSSSCPTRCTGAGNEARARAPGPAVSGVPSPAVRRPGEPRSTGCGKPHRFTWWPGGRWQLTRGSRHACVLAGVIVLATALPVLALEGRVVDQRTGQPTPGPRSRCSGGLASSTTDGDGRFVMKPDPAVPFELLVILPGERVTKPLLIERCPRTASSRSPSPRSSRKRSRSTGGAAPDIETTPGNATALVPGEDIQTRQPANLTQALESVPGVSSVSEGHAAVPAIRGLARGRTLI